MSLLSPQDIRAYGADGGLDTAHLQDVIDREEAEIVRRYGAHYDAVTPIVETAVGGGKSIFMGRQIGTVTSIAEYLYIGDTAPVTLTATDYFVWPLEGRIERINARWGAYATVTYTPVDDTARRKSVLVELCRLSSTQDTGGTVSGLGFSISNTGGARDYEVQREVLYARLGWLSR